ncbi:MAG: hypothetical protein IJU60_01670 [Acholeplasmatales bacterium]|nr:hypothetical protein [Acholeplasmatales bacterium]
MNKIIIYGSKYGSTEKYAKELARRINVEAIEYDKIKNINDYDYIIYLGALYAGGVMGLVKTLKKIDDLKSKEFVIVTVGAADTTDSNNVNNIENGINKQIPEEIYNKAKIFHLRGAIYYSKLDVKHKIMMKLLYNKAKNIPEEKQTPEIKLMLETYNKEADFVDFNTLDNIINVL